MAQVLTANRLGDGVVVFFGTDGIWVEQIDAARVFSDAKAADAAMPEAKQGEADNRVLDIYAVDVAERDGRLSPIRLRELIRATGPTIHPEHGKAPLGTRG